MKKCEFSETQFFIGYTRELFNSIPGIFSMVAPSTVAEKAFAADLILRHFSKNHRYKFSVYYQFKRSHLYNNEIFSSLRGGNVIDTAHKRMYGFEIYNSRKTRQFNVLQRLATKPRSKVFYCAPLFHSTEMYNKYFEGKTIKRNSILFDVADPEIQRIRIPLNSTHRFIFNRREQFICSDPIRIKGFVGNKIRFDKMINEFEPIEFVNGIDIELKNLNEILSDFKTKWKMPSIGNNRYISFLDYREWLFRVLNIHWVPIFERNKNVS